MQCSDCGSEVPGGKKICPWCGSTALERPPAAFGITPRARKPARTGKCDDCGSVVPAGGTTCPWCGGLVSRRTSRSPAAKAYAPPPGAHTSPVGFVMGAPAPADRKICLHCGGQASEDSLLCLACSKKLDIESIPVPEEEQPVQRALIKMFGERIGKKIAQRILVFSPHGRFGWLNTPIGVLVVISVTLLAKLGLGTTMQYYGLYTTRNISILRLVSVIGLLCFIVFSTIKQIRAMKKRTAAIVRLCVSSGLGVAFLLAYILLVWRV
jgi:RNA polymerase subunit RPABC4/transcription elongation factor Spt4